MFFLGGEEERKPPLAVAGTRAHQVVKTCERIKG
jgi:hypothetical protein